MECTVQTGRSTDNMDLITELSREDLLKIIKTALVSKSASQTTDSKDAVEEEGEQREEAGINISTTTLLQSPAQQEAQRNHSTPNKNMVGINEIHEPVIFELPMDNIIKKLNEIQNLSSLLGNKEKKLKNWYSSLISISDTFISDLNSDKERINTDFVKSLETITKIFSITSKFSPIETINESVLTPTIRNLIMDFKSNTFTSLENYCSDDLSMYTLNKDVEENLIRLIPILSQQLLTFKKQLKKFYSLYDLVDDYEHLDRSFLSKIPTKTDIGLFNEINEATDIKSILQTNFNQINPDLIRQLDVESTKLNQYIVRKAQLLKAVIIDVTTLNHELFRSNEDQYLQLPTSVDDTESIISHFGVKSAVFSHYDNILGELQNLKIERENLLNSYLVQVEQLWSILRPDSNEIQHFLKQNKNLYADSLQNFENLLSELEDEKLTNIKQFIRISREKIQGFWDILMYDEESRSSYTDFYIEDEQQFDEKLLDSHSAELERLRKESECLKPLLNLISKLNDLVEEKKLLDDASKDPSRLLKRNSFQILKQEERTRNMLGKRFPLVIEQLRAKIDSFEKENGRTFKLNGESYLQKLDEVENFCIHSRRNYRSSFNSPTTSSKCRKFTSMPSQRKTTSRAKIVATPSRSIIRKRDPSQMTNPFLSKEPTPLRKQRTMTPSFSSSSKTSTPQSLSTEPIILRGRSPVRSLNLNGSTKLTSFPTIKSPNLASSISFSAPSKPNSVPSTTMAKTSSKKVPLRSSMGLINKPNFNNIPSSIKKPTSIPVEELSDSILEYSDTENEDKQDTSKRDKENMNPVTMATISKVMSEQTHHFNLSLDSETF